MNRYYAQKVKLDIVQFWQNIGGMSKGMLLLWILVWSLKNVLTLAVSWQNFLLMSILSTFLYVVIMYVWCMNEDERTLCRTAVNKLCRR